jgi:alkylation response protein AidB-like acyl-CoA dehydrogenase
MDRKHYADEHLAFGEAFRAFIDRSVAPNLEQYERDGITPRDIFLEAGRGGFLGMAIPEQYGGGGVSDFRFNQILDEQVALSGVGGAGVGITLHNDVCVPYFLSYATEQQKQRWLPGIAAGELITAIAMTEPGAGSDLAGMRTRAERAGDHYVVNGAKTFITNGINADLVIVACKTGSDPNDRRGGISLLVLERGMAGFERGRNLDKLGMHSQDTAELFFTDMRVPVDNLLGGEGAGFQQLTQKLPQERTSLAVTGVSESRAAFEETVAYVKNRTAFGASIASFQNTKFILADIATEIDVAQAYVDRCVDRLCSGELSAADASKAKLFCTEMQGRVVDRCLQCHGGYGYMSEYRISRRYADARVSRIYGGTSEIMKSVIANSIGL